VKPRLPSRLVKRVKAAQNPYLYRVNSPVPGQVRRKLYPSPACGRAESVKRHPELLTGRHEELIPNCGDVDSSVPPSASEHRAHIPLDYRTCPGGALQHESGSATFGMTPMVLADVKQAASERALK